MGALDNKLIVITGASSGIGADAARTSARAGAELILLARRQAQLDEVRAQIEGAGGTAHTYTVDLADAAAAAAVVEQIQKDHRTPDVIFNNAGAGEWLEWDATSVDQAERAMTVPYFAALRVTLPFLPAMVERGSGLIVNNTSPAAVIKIPGTGAYAVARVAMRSFSDLLNEDLRGTGVRATLLMPFEVTSDYFDKHPGSKDRVPWLAKMIAGTSTPQECADAFVEIVKRPRPSVVLPRVRGTLVHWWNRWFPLTWAARMSGWRRSSLPAAGESDE